MVLEVIDDIGCTSDEVKEINFIDDISVSLSERVVFENCDSGAYCMDITIDPVNEVKSKTWKLNNQVIADPGNSYCYSSQSAFSSTFEVSVVHNNGCKSETSFSVDHAYPKTSEAAYFVEDTICYKDSLILIIPFTPGTNDSISLVILDAELKPELDTVIHPPSTGDYDYFEYIPDTIGVHYYHIQSLNAPELCFRDQDILAWVRGPYVVPGLVNGAQCVNRDTVYFIDVSSYFLNSTSIEYEWQFGDPDATQNIDFNPITPYKDYNYSTARNTMHFYPKISCYPSSFEVTDPVYGCTDKVEFTVTTGFPAKMGLQILDPKPLYCEGDSVYYDIFVEYWKDQNIPNDHKRLPKCAPPSGIGLETAAFVKVGPGWFTFDTDKSCEFEDMRLISGDGKTSYFPNGDTIPATISPDVCFDDTLYDDILKIDITPEINATLIEATPQGCDKIKVSLRLSSEDSIRFYKLKWSEQDSIFHDYGELVLIDTIMKLEFDTGSYYLETSVYSSCQCENTDTFSFEKGLRPMFNVTACAGQSLY